MPCALLLIAASALAWADGSGTVPFYSSASIVNAASNQPELAPNGLSTVYGKNLAWDTRAAVTEDIRANVMPIGLAGVRVYVAGIPSSLYYVSPTQINFLVPAILRPGECDVWVFRDGMVGEKVRVTLQEAAPALFQADENTAVATHADGSVVTASNPAKAWEAIVLYAAGLGRTAPDVTSGELATVAAPIRERAALRITIGDVVVEDRLIFYAGLTPGFAGLYQINFWLPPTQGEDPAIRIWIGDRGSPPLRLITRPLPE